MRKESFGKTRKTGDYYGKIFLSNECGYYQITLANHIDRMKAIFLITNTEVWVTVDQVDSGCVLDRKYPTVFGVGYLGDYPTTNEGGRKSKEYNTWRGMLARCYGRTNLDAYKYCIVSEEFHDASYFKDWYNKQRGCHRDDFHLDKDILSDGCKIYAEDICVLVPREVNNFFVDHSDKRGVVGYPVGVSYDSKCADNPFTVKYGGHGGEPHVSYHNNEWSAFLAYKRAKESRARELAEKWCGHIDDRVYDKLITYKVLLTD